MLSTLRLKDCVHAAPQVVKSNALTLGAGGFREAVTPAAEHRDSAGTLPGGRALLWSHSTGQRRRRLPLQVTETPEWLNEGVFRFCYSGSLVCVVYAYLFYALMGCIVFLQVRIIHSVLSVFLVVSKDHVPGNKMTNSEATMSSVQAALAVNRWAAVCTKHYVTLR